MLLHVLRGLFVLAVAAVAMSYIADQSAQSEPLFEYYKDAALLFCIGLAFVVLAVDVFIPQKSLTAIAGLSFGLVTGMVAAYGLSLILNLLVESFAIGLKDSSMLAAVKVLVGVICCYFAVSFILQTKDDIRFVIPYIEFSKQTKGAHRMILDTSVIIDGRITDICDTRIIDSQLVVPRFVLQELQAVADSNDKLKRNRGRRGLDMLNKLQSNANVEVHIMDAQLSPAESAESVDQKLVSLAKRLDGRVVTNDYNLNKIAQLRGVEVININDLANALKPVFLPGENLEVKVIKQGEELGQGVGYLEDGTMVVIEGGRERIGHTLAISVTSVLQTSAGRMIFGRCEGPPIPERKRTRVRTNA